MCFRWRRRADRIDGVEDCRPSPTPPPERDPLDEPLAALEADFAVAMGGPERTAKACAKISVILGSQVDTSTAAKLLPAAALLRKRGGAVAEPLFALLEQASRQCDQPWTLLRSLLEARDPQLAVRALRLLAEQVVLKRLPAEADLAEALAGLLDRQERLSADRAVLETVARVLQSQPTPIAAPLLDLLADDPRPPVRRLAAALLDLPGRPADEGTIRRLLGDEATAVLAPYLLYTRASHRDLLDLAIPGVIRETAASFRRAEATCGAEQLRAAIGELGWLRVNLGLEALPCVGLSVAGSFPLLLAPEEAALLERRLPAQRVFEKTLLLAHGGAGDRGGSGGGGDAIARFRRYNLAHAEALADILDVAPLSPDKVRRVVERMDLIVADFVTLFQAHWDECGALPNVYKGLKDAVLAELGRAPADQPLSAELTRLVQAFEDPAVLAEVRTLHGLKRYLHQRGLRLGFRLVESGRGTNRTFDLAVAAPRCGWQVVRAIQYVDFEPPTERVAAVFHRTLFGRPLPAEGGVVRPPWPVWIAAEGLARQLIFGQEKFPVLKVFCYGNEVHYYASFGNHPAFVRIDYSPPQRGGMIDVEYFGVSKFELENHPAPDLDGIRDFFRAMEFDCKVDRTRIHARYDKERALHLGELCAKAAAMMRLTPHLMEVDWLIGSLEISPEARRRVAAAWADFFVRHGVLPARQFLTSDRRRILAAVRDEAAGTREEAWDEREVYRDRFTGTDPTAVLEVLGGLLSAAGLTAEGLLGNAAQWRPHQIALEATLLNTLRQAAGRGQIRLANGECEVGPAECFQPVHEAARFAELLAGNDDQLTAAARLAALIGPLERGLHFLVSGTVNGREVQRAALPLCGGGLGLCVLRTADGVPTLAFYTEADVLFRGRADVDAPWMENARFDVAELAVLLRRNSYLAEAGAEGPAPALQIIRAAFRSAGERPPRRPMAGERVVSGLRAAPGRAVGRAVSAVEDRPEADFDGAIMVAPAVRPQDGPCLYRSTGVVSTGGGILSHAGLLAAQFRKPALIVKGQWRIGPDGRQRLIYEPLDYDETEQVVGPYQVTLRRNFRRHEETLEEGDLVVVDADGGLFCVLGQDRDALALHEELQRLRDACAHLQATTAAPDLLAWRGRRLRAVHHLEKLVSRFTDPVLARHAVQELLLPGRPGEVSAVRHEQDKLLRLLLANPMVGPAAREFIRETAEFAGRRHRQAMAQALEDIPTSPRPYEVLVLRLTAHRDGETLATIAGSLRSCGLEPPFPSEQVGATSRMELLTRRRLEALREDVEARAGAAEASAQPWRLRHLLRSLERIDLVLRTPEAERETPRRLRESLVRHDAETTARCRDRRILERVDAGLEIQALIGSKAANLAEVQRLIDPDLVPPWFVVTDRAFREALEQPADWPGEPGPARPGAGTLREAIEHTLADAGLTNAAKSEIVRRLWESTPLPGDLVEELRGAIRRLAAGEEHGTSKDPDGPFLAVRSSGWEEDTEATARAGEFETFLFVRGEEAVLRHIRLVWSGFWTERAIHHRAVLGLPPAATGGGVLVQRMVRSRVSGVLQTVNLPEGHTGEMVVNAGLGLGEGVVSGTVAADQIIVARRGDVQTEPLRFRYLTADKREQVVFDRRRGGGTVREETLYHQRMRAALEYIELCELVRAADRLEHDYGYPLDIEFGIEGRRLRLLQVRPLATFAAVVRETVEAYPL